MRHPSVKQFSPQYSHRRGIFGEREYHNDHMHSLYLLPRICVLSRGVSSQQSPLREG